MSRLADADQRTAGPRAGHRRRRHAQGAFWTPRRIVAAVAVALALAVAAWATPPVRKELAASFTRLPSEYTELYFTRAPVAARGTVVVPLSVVEHGPHPSPYRLRVQLVTAAGRTTATTTLTLTPRHTDVPQNTTVRLPYVRRAAVVRVALLDRGQTLHYDLRGTE
ncbi:hypothetical protein [Streptomyces gilvus]|uniref:hypothetical protein n=1 Tax=Streptomyces gilvus TaxID=2920937 RepID=UPI001F0FA100|nr:hypothetical protein [Streptomyces sp. CME 23]MCH5673550.1 hypothetical protein [Streptomyces sp. CME 23]